MGEQDDTPAAVLTNAQRAYLHGDREYRPSVEMDVKNRIRNRVANGIEDFSLLFGQWPEEERERVFRDPSAEPFDKGLVDMLALVYLETHLDGRFKNLLMRAVNRAEARKAGSDTITYKTNFEPEPTGPPPYDAAIEKLGAAREDLSDDEAQALVDLIQKNPEFSQSDLVEMREVLKEQLDEAMEEYEQAVINSKEYERERIARRRSNDGRDHEDDGGGA